MKIIILNKTYYISSFFKEFIGSNTAGENKELLKKRAEWAMSIDEHKVAAELYVSAEEFDLAIDIMVHNCWTQM